MSTEAVITTAIEDEGNSMAGSIAVTGPGHVARGVSLTAAGVSLHDVMLRRASVSNGNDGLCAASRFKLTRVGINVMNVHLYTPVRVHLTRISPILCLSV